MKKLTKKEIEAAIESIAPVMPPAFEKRKELHEIVSGSELNDRSEKKDHDPKQKYKVFNNKMAPINYADRIKKVNKTGGERGVFDMLLHYCLKFNNLAKMYEKHEGKDGENAKMIEYCNQPQFQDMMGYFKQIADGEKTYKDLYRIL